MWLFFISKDKVCFKGTRFEPVDAVRAKLMELMNKLSEDDLQHCFQQWKICMERYRDRGGERSTSRVTIFLWCNFFNKKCTNISPVILQPHHVSCLVQTIIPLSYHWHPSAASNLFWANAFFTIPMCATCSVHINLLSLEHCNNFWRKVNIIVPL